MERYNLTEKSTASLFFIIPTIFVIIGLMFFPYRQPEAKTILEELLPLLLFVSLILLGIGFFIKKEGLGNRIKIAGWLLFSFFWSTQINTLYYGEDGDIANAFLCIAGVYVLFYIAYHEWVSIKTNEKINCLNWAAGAAAISGIIYFGIEMTPLKMQLIEMVAAQSAWVLNIFTGNVVQKGVDISWNQAHVGIIFACTAVQSMVLFVGMILPLKNVDMKRKFYGLLITVIPIYFLNLIRNALVAYLVGINGPDFFSTAHNIIGKGGSLIALVILLVIVIKVVPEIFDEIICLTDLYKRDGPVERFLKSFIRRKKA